MADLAKQISGDLQKQIEFIFSPNLVSPISGLSWRRAMVLPGFQDWRMSSRRNWSSLPMG